MEREYPSSKTHDAACLERASLAAPSSCQLASINAYQDRTRSDHAPELHEHFQIGGLSSTRRWPLLFSSRSAGHTHPVERLRAAHGGLYSRMALVGASAVHTIAHQSLVKLFADPRHLKSVLSKSSLSVSQHGVKGNGRVPNSTGELHKSKGEFPNVGC